MAARANELMNRKQVAYVLGRNAPGIFEIALWMRGFENFYCDMLANPPSPRRCSTSSWRSR